LIDRGSSFKQARDSASPFETNKPGAHDNLIAARKSHLAVAFVSFARLPGGKATTAC